MKLIIGLGNPGEDYKNTRHNTGFRVIDVLGKNSKFVALKSSEFMNSSGDFVKKMVDKYKVDLSNLYIVHDDLDLALGSYKIQFGRGPKDHNGIESVDREFGTKEYWHVRVGVDKRDPQNRVLGEEYVLQNFSDEESKILEKGIKEICKKLETILVSSN